MKLKIKIPKQTINKSFQKEKIGRLDFENFKTQLQILTRKIDNNESEEHPKNLLIKFLNNTFYQNNEVNTKGRTDLAIYNGADNKSTVGVIFETKKPDNQADMISKTDINKKAFHEIVLYYLRERIEFENIEIKNIIITDINDWYIFDAADFERVFYSKGTCSLVAEYKKWKSGQKISKNTDFFYKEIAKKYIQNCETEIDCTYLDLTAFKNLSALPESKLINLYKLFSPQHLLKIPHKNDSNTLDTGFYNELLHIIGLEEVSENNKKLIKRKKEKSRNSASLMENTIAILEIENRLKHIQNLENRYGKTPEEQLVNVAIELNITWINRILFLKLLEAQLIQYQNDSSDYKFLTTKNIKFFGELNELFFEVLAKKPKQRSLDIKNEFKHIPYLNSSLFEISRLEDETIRINSLKSHKKIPLYSKSVLKSKSELAIIEYILKFLDAYDFTSEGKAKVQEENKNLINASVLGLIFEKINGYKEGSYFTPGYITMYMSRENIRSAVVQKFKTAALPNFKTLTKFADLKDLIEDRKQVNQIINSLKICDPAVGSGHFLVSALNEIIAIKSELGILEYRNKNRVKNYKIEVINDELIISDKETDELFEYNLSRKGNAIDYKQELQEALFHEKQTIIENCLFGVDINPNSVNITRLRLWIELLKNSYYTEESGFSELETLPNIDINIKQGNSLVGRFALNGNGLTNGQARKMKLATEKYKMQVILYKSTNDKAVKQRAEDEIQRIKQEFAQNVNPTDKDYILLRQKRAKLGEVPMLFTQAEKEIWKVKIEKLTKEVAELEQKYDEKLQTLYGKAFEWRFEFPEVLDENGDFTGFDVVMGNPPYIDSEYMVKQGNKIRSYLTEKFTTAKGNWDIFVPFVEFAFTILKHNGNFSYIVPNKIIGAKYSKHLIEFLLTKKINVIRDYSREKIFAKADVYPIVISVTNTLPKENDNIRFEPMKSVSKVRYTNKILLKEVKKDPNIDKYFADSNTRMVINKIKKFEKLENFVSLISDGATVSEAYIIKDKIFDSKKYRSQYKKIINTGTIDPYKILWGEKPMKYIKDNYKNPVIKSADLKKISKKRFAQADTAKIIVAGMSKIIEAVFDNGDILAAKSTNIIIDDNTDKLKIILAILNSKLMSFYVTKYYHSNKMSGGYLNISPRILKALPIQLTESETIISRIDKILNIKQLNPKTSTERLENEIDKMVYKLYNLTKEEIAIIEDK